MPSAFRFRRNKRRLMMKNYGGFLRRHQRNPQGPAGEGYLVSDGLGLHTPGYSWVLDDGDVVQRCTCPSRPLHRCHVRNPTTNQVFCFLNEDILECSGGSEDSFPEPDFDETRGDF